VAKLTDYLDPTTLREQQQAFSRLAGVPLLICDPDGTPLADAATARGAAPPADGAGESVPITIGAEVVGRVRIPEAVGAPQVTAAARTLAETLARLAQSQGEARTRAIELAALFSLTAEFAGPRDLQGMLDLVAHTVVRALKAKACAIRLLSPDRTELELLAVVNLSQEYLGKGPVVVSRSQIDHDVLTTGRPIYIADQGTDPRVMYPQEARREGIVSAICAPLMYKGRAEGVIRVYTADAHVFDWFEIAMLQSIAAHAAAAVVNARLVEDALRAADIKRQLRTAADVQRRLTPAAMPKLAGFDIGAVYAPCYELGGDFYDFLPLPGDNLGVAVCDVAGKGIPASLLMASIRASLRAHATNIYDMSVVLERVNRDLCADTLVGNFATLFYGVIDARSRRFTYANAGHVPPVLLRGGKGRGLLTGGGVLGISSENRWGHEHLTLQSGDVLLACTDGLTEAMNGAEEAFGAPRVEQAALEAIAKDLPAQAIARHVVWEMRRFTGLQSRFDDLTLAVIKVL
jgi:serine phosphatase RsbU (regulator of sigma subunit)